ncbi:MAG TPA: MaoC family dehydratase N-terminal domain-containing protein [Spirochaetota bacterium]|nr:MaoC family dehydratase N-terminal domain-containing protein [Spirochaetota bacterium]HOL56687.1 MaoC family dehydratase N-terminal domain-containing protein [Spirochaetota bacterium]HPP04566.1 MaoC family dehydratase N-terminal domain-containing protein [Spirochaetota bacterium]
MVDTSLEGKEYSPFTFEVDRSKIKELCMAIGDNNPLFFDKEYAIKQGYKDTPAPLTFATVMNFWGNPEIWDRMKEIGIDIKRLLHAKEEYEYFSPIYPGDILKGVMSVDSIRSSSLMDMVTFKSTFTRDGEVVLIAKMTIVVMQQ